MLIDRLFVYKKVTIQTQDTVCMQHTRPTLKTEKKSTLEDMYESYKPIIETLNRSIKYLYFYD